MIAHRFRFAFIVVIVLYCEAVMPHASSPLFANPVVAPSRPSAPTEDQSGEALPQIVFLNQSAVLIASKKNKIKYKEHQARLIDMMNKGVTVLICPDCMKQYGIKESDLIDGVQIGKLGEP